MPAPAGSLPRPCGLSLLAHSDPGRPLMCPKCGWSVGAAKSDPLPTCRLKSHWSRAMEGAAAASAAGRCGQVGNDKS